MKGVIIMIGGCWVKIPCKALTDERLTRADIAVLGYMADKLKGDTKAVSVSEIVRACEVCKNSVLRAIDKLCECGYLRADKRAGKPTLYTQLCIPSKSATKRPERASELELESKYDFAWNAELKGEKQA